MRSGKPFVVGASMISSEPIRNLIIRTPQIGTRTPVLDHDGHSLVAALRTIHEIGDREALYEAIEDAFPGATINFAADAGNRFLLQFLQDGLLRPLNQSELSDGTLRYLLLVAALLTPQSAFTVSIKRTRNQLCIRICYQHWDA